MTDNTNANANANDFTISITIRDTFRTKCRALEQYLYAHRIKPRSWSKDENNLTVWEYPTTQSLVDLIRQYVSLQVFETGWEARR